MKIRIGFVSNSSSASFTIAFKSTLKEKTVNNIFNIIGSRWDSLTKDRKNIYALHVDTTMFNDWQSFYSWVLIKLLSDGIFKELQFESISGTREYEKIHGAGSISEIDEWHLNKDENKKYQKFIKEVQTEIYLEQIEKGTASKKVIAQVAKYLLKK